MLSIVLVTVWLANLDAGVAHRGSDIWMEILNVEWVHVIPDHQLQQKPRELDTMFAIRDILLDQWPHLDE